jgi:hypothetical protein
MPNSPTDPQSSPIELRDQLATESVIASYIHAISDRHRRSDHAPDEPGYSAPGD